MLLAALVATTDTVATTSSRTAKRDALAELLASLDPDEVGPATGILIGDPRQGRIGVGWSTIASVRVDPAAEPSLTVGDLDRALDLLAATSGAGSNARRTELLTDLLRRATAPEADFIRRMLTGEMRQGALDGVMTDAIAAAAHVPATAVRRAAMLSGDLRRTATIARRDGRAGLDAIGLTVLHPIQPMLAATAAGVTDALDGSGATDQLSSVEWKLDGARIQVHRDGDEVRIFTRNLNDVTDRLAEVAAVTRSLPAQQLVLDAEVLSIDATNRPHAFQDTMSSFGREGPDDGSRLGLQPFFFDVLHVDGRDLIDEPLGDRLRVLDDVARPFRIPGIVTADASEAEAFLEQAIDAGHEGVMVKTLDSPYAAGRRGKAWRKVKPVRLFDLVVLAAEWGHGRRRGWLSNLHLGARDTAGTFVMVGKTFKGLTDELLAWQTTRLRELALGSDDYTVHVRPELVVEIALDGVQSSRRYPGRVALRFARVRRYRDDKTADAADPIEAVQALLPG